MEARLRQRKESFGEHVVSYRKSVVFMAKGKVVQFHALIMMGEA